jgi:hypothetical protein
LTAGSKLVPFHRPALNAVETEPEIVVAARGVMQLHDENALARARLPPDAGSRRLEITLALVFLSVIRRVSQSARPVR